MKAPSIQEVKHWIVRCRLDYIFSRCVLFQCMTVPALIEPWPVAFHAATYSSGRRVMQTSVQMFEKDAKNKTRKLQLWDSGMPLWGHVGSIKSEAEMISPHTSCRDESRWMSLPFRSAHVAVTICPSENFDWYHTPLKHSHKSHFRTSLEWISAPYSNLWTFLFAMSRFERYSWRSGQELLSSAEMQEAMQRNDCNVAISMFRHQSHSWQVRPGRKLRVLKREPKEKMCKT